MRQTLLTLAAVAAFCSSLLGAEYKAVEGWTKLPEGRELLGNMHGDVALASNGELYVSLMDRKGGVQVFSQDGKFLRQLAGTPDDFHSMVIHQEADGEFIYGPRLSKGNIVKLTLEGKEVLNIPGSAIPDEFKEKGTLRLTGIDVAPNGDIYVSDGYASSYIHRFDKTGKYLQSFGGKKEPYNFKTLHKLCVDTRFEPARLLVTDRLNMRLLHLTLDGQIIGVYASDLRKPSALHLHGDEVICGELDGQVTVLDKAGQITGRIGPNDRKEDEVGSNKATPDRWQTGVLISPHGVTCNDHGDIFVSEYNMYGRLHRFNRQ